METNINIDLTEVVILDRREFVNMAWSERTALEKFAVVSTTYDDLLGHIATIICGHDRDALLCISEHLAGHYKDTPLDEWTKTMLEFGERLREPEKAAPPAPKVTLPDLDEKPAPKFNRGDIVCRRNTLSPNKYKVIGFDRDRVEIQTMIPGELPGRTYVEAHELELVPVALTQKFKVGDRVRVTTQFLKCHGRIGTISQYIARRLGFDYEVAFGDEDKGGLRMFNSDELELFPALDDGAFLSDEEDARLVKMGREMWEEYVYDHRLGEAPVGCIEVGNIRFRNDPNDEVDKTWRDLFLSSPPGLITPANRALLRRVERERATPTAKASE